MYEGQTATQQERRADSLGRPTHPFTEGNMVGANKALSPIADAMAQLRQRVEVLHHACQGIGSRIESTLMQAAEVSKDNRAPQEVPQSSLHGEILEQVYALDRLHTMLSDIGRRVTL